MLKIVCLFAIIAVASVSAEPKPGVLAYSAPLVAAPAAYAAAPAAYVAEGGAVYERTYHGNIAPVAAYASAPYVAASPFAYSAPYVAAAPAPVLFK
ncbi:cuticle protein 16.5-like [Uranotaenia lowii]|uniref:cuticle protein 16.5-like n=1 Tax=Uranotaenia lowii TaxID=190385 RepID=UPI00247892EC|nr:cuticle protein 16.5-like [Uranotaenia lowii]